VSAPRPPLPGAAAEAPTPWRRLDARMILVDALRLAVSLAPGACALLLFDVDPTPGTLWPLAAVAAWGLVSSTLDVLRWIKTRYRVTATHVERRTGLIVRKYRSVQRERIRSVDSEARFRHRIAGLRLVTIGAGQQNTAYEAALSLDAVSRTEAQALRRELMGEWADPAAHPEGGPSSAPSGAEVYARLRPHWIVYNLFSVWAYVVAAGVLWAVFLFTTSIGLDPWSWAAALVDWRALGWVWGTLLVLAAVGAVGVVGMAATFVTGHWNFRLMRVSGPEGSVLRTTQGLLRTREVDRDDARLKGAETSEPVLWRWMGMADTTVITTGLNVWGESPTILPRGPIAVARRVVRSVLRQSPSPLEAPLMPHPRAALRRRVLWATLVTGAIAGIVAWLGASGPVEEGAWLPAAAVLWPAALLLALAAYRALGHTITGDYVVTRSGMAARATAALQRRAVSGASVRQSVLQRRLGLTTVSLTTAAGYGVYEAPDVAAAEAVAVAAAAAPGLWTPFLEGSDTGRARCHGSPAAAVGTGESEVDVPR
jgi:putative membrane protein